MMTVGLVYISMSAKLVQKAERKEFGTMVSNWSLGLEAILM